MKQEIYQLLIQAFPNATIVVEVVDNHAKVVIRDASFAPLSRVARHQLVYRQLAELISSGKLHALTIDPQVESSSSQSAFTNE